MPSFLIQESRGRFVRQAQRRLQALGYYNGTIDGYYGLTTAMAVAEFQCENDLIIDGEIGLQTWLKLGLGGEATALPSTHKDKVCSPQMAYIQHEEESFYGSAALAMVFSAYGLAVEPSVLDSKSLEMTSDNEMPPNITRFMNAFMNLDVEESTFKSWDEVVQRMKDGWIVLLVYDPSGLPGWNHTHPRMAPIQCIGNDWLLVLCPEKGKVLYSHKAMEQAMKAHEHADLFYVRKA